MSLEDLTPEARDELAKLAKDIFDTPETRKEGLRLAKKLRPDMPIPELEIEDFTRSAVTKANERVEQLEAKLREKDAMDELNNRRNKLKAKGLIDKDEDIEKVEEVMLKNGITDHETAANYWRWMQQAAAPTPTGYNPSAIKDFDLSKFWKNPTAGARDEAKNALMELRKNPRPIGL